MLSFLKILGTCCLLLCAGPLWAAGRVVEGPATVLDGAHLMVRGEVIRLHDVAAVPRSTRCGAGWACGAWVAGELAARYDARRLTCFEFRRDTNGLMVAVCFDGQVDIAAALVASGLAFAQEAGAYERAAQQARRLRAGLLHFGIIAPSDLRRPPVPRAEVSERLRDAAL